MHPHRFKESPTIGFSMSPGHEAYDAELMAIAYGLLLLSRRGGRGQDFTPFTDSKAAMKRIMSDAPRLGQEIGIGAIGLAQRLIDQGNTVTHRWTPAHRGVEGNEQADQRAREAAAIPPPRNAVRRYILAFLRRATEQGTHQWRRDRR